MRDTVAYCESRNPGASEAPHARSVDAIIARSGPAGVAHGHRWMAQGGAQEAFK